MSMPAKKTRAVATKKRGNAKTKMAEYQKRARRGLIGLTLKWIDADPFSESAEISGTAVTHSNPTQRLICQDMWRRCSEWITQSEFTWQVDMTVIFETDHRGQKRDEYEFIFTCTLRGNKSDILNDAMKAALEESVAGNAAFPDGHKNKGVYQRCEFSAKVVGV